MRVPVVDGSLMGNFGRAGISRSVVRRGCSRLSVVRRSHGPGFEHGSSSSRIRMRRVAFDSDAALLSAAAVRRRLKKAKRSESKRSMRSESEAKAPSVAKAKRRRSRLASGRACLCRFRPRHPPWQGLAYYSMFFGSCQVTRRKGRFPREHKGLRRAAAGVFTEVVNGARVISRGRRCYAICSMCYAMYSIATARVARW